MNHSLRQSLGWNRQTVWFGLTVGAAAWSVRRLLQTARGKVRRSGAPVRRLLFRRSGAARRAVWFGMFAGGSAWLLRRMGGGTRMEERATTAVTVPDMGQLLRAHEVSRVGLMFGLLGGAVAWLLHLLLAYAIGEFGCATDLREVVFLGLTGVAWLLIALSLAMLLLAGAAAYVAWRNEQQLRGLPERIFDLRGSETYLARAGRITSVLFAFIILIESVPIIYYLRHC